MRVETMKNDTISKDPPVASAVPTKTNTTRLIRAVHTSETVRVYQAYSDEIADSAVKSQTFAAAMEKGLWSPTRMTWIKPSKVWMAYRCGWTVLKDSKQSRVLALDLDRKHFEALLSQATLSSQETKKGWKRPVVVQWDPERYLKYAKTPLDQVYTKPNVAVRSIQIGLRRPANKCLMDPNVVKRITDVTKDFRSTLQAIEQGKAIDDVATLLWPNGEVETNMTVPTHISERLEMTQEGDVTLAA